MMNFDVPKTPVGIAYVLSLAGAVLATVVMGGALWAKASARPAVYLVTGNDDPKVVTPGVIPDALARDYARDFFATLETYVPATVDKNLAFLQTRIAPPAYHEFERFAANLKKLVKESKQTSQLFVADPSATSVLRDGKRVEVIFRAVRRIYVEHALLQEAAAVYRLAIVPGEPTRENPTGLVVAGFSFKVDPPKAESPERSHEK
ncbi:MAG TPA: VirB8/TrbF family protein [Planctomycetota bacterium]|nr:VirB8/TrbF family protein [Planctomycetota bacterium]